MVLMILVRSERAILFLSLWLPYAPMVGAAAAAAAAAEATSIARYLVWRARARARDKTGVLGAVPAGGYVPRAAWRARL